MRMTVINCDMCGNAIGESPIKILMRHVDRNAGGPRTVDHIGSDDISGLDFCPVCAENIGNCIKNMAKMLE